jgi:two-component system sensor histidine kinase/response regulator
LLYVAPDVPTQIVGDPLRLSQVLTNLLGNAIKFTEQGSVLLRVTCDAGDGGGPGNLLFQVADTGIGLSPHQLEHLFMPFQQADVSMTRKFGGTGLGLAICKRLVELMGGSIGVRANAGDGSLFHFSLPLSHACPQWPLEPGERPLRGVRMLVIDDAAVGREVLAGLLRDLGAEGEAWPDLSRVTEQSRDIDLLVLDNGLLDAGSAQVLAGLAKHRGQQWPGLVLVTSLREREKLLRETAGIPYRALLARPFSGTALLDACEVALGRKGTDAPSQPQQVPVDRSRELLEGAEILLVDDIRTNQMVARAILARHGMRVTLCGNGQEALERIGERPFAAVLMDIQMPVMDGYQATRAIRADSAYDAIPIIAMTAHAMIGDREKCLQSGMDDYISKPVNAARLIELLAKWVARRDGGAPRMADGA